MSNMSSAEPHTLDPNTWVDKYADGLLSFSFSRLNDREAAKDLVQDTFFSAYKNLNQYRGEVQEKSWLFAILKNKIIDYYRSKSRSMVRMPEGDVIEENAMFDENGHWTTSGLPSVWSSDLKDGLEQKEFYVVLDNCRKKLPEMQNIVFSMKLLDEYPASQICKELGVSASNYWVLMHRAKLRIRKCLEMNWFKI